jgi:hypothetical protein
LKSCFARTGTWQQATKYVSALVSELPKRNEWTIAEHAGDKPPDRTQRLLNRAAWDESAAMSQIRRFAVEGLDAAAKFPEQIATTDWLLRRGPCGAFSTGHRSD